MQAPLQDPAYPSQAQWDRLQQHVEKRTPLQPSSIHFPPLPPVSQSQSRTPAKRQAPWIPSRSRSWSRQRVGGAQTVQWGVQPAREPMWESKDKTANNSRNSDLSDLRRMVTQLRDGNSRLFNQLEQTKQEYTNLREQLQAGATLPTQHPHLSSARWRHNPNLLPLREREALRPPLFNRKSTKPLPKCCRTQHDSPVSPHNLTASGRHRLTSKNTMQKSNACIIWQWNCLVTNGERTAKKVYKASVVPPRAQISYL